MEDPGFRSVKLSLINRFTTETSGRENPYMPLYGTCCIPSQERLDAETYIPNFLEHKTYIDVNKKQLNIYHRPNNFKKDRSYDSSQIDQLYIKPSTDGMGHQTLHMVINGLDGQKHEKLITVTSISKAKYLEQEIENYLNIPDREVLEMKM